MILGLSQQFSANWHFADKTFLSPNDFYYWYIVIFSCSQQSSASRDFAETTKWNVFFSPGNFYYWYLVILDRSQQFLQSWDSAKTIFWNFYHSFTTFINDISDFRPFSAIFSKLRVCWDNMYKHFFTSNNFYYWYVVILGHSQQFPLSWDFAETTS